MNISWLRTGCHCQYHRSNNNLRTRGDFFYLNSLRRVLFYGDDKCTSESQVNGMESHSTELSKQRTSTTAMTT
ncbi:hypothetical protein VZ17_001196 [Salmonella enterica subsp. enterica serovar Abaetetuba]|nr:hypothetical protein [Salmonella enterica subsp. enterica serovar Abaetetuba]